MQPQHTIMINPRLYHDVIKPHGPGKAVNAGGGGDTDKGTLYKSDCSAKWKESKELSESLCNNLISVSSLRM